MKKLILTAAIAALSFNALAVDAGSEFKIGYSNPLAITLALENNGKVTLEKKNTSDGVWYYVDTHFNVTATNADSVPVLYTISLSNMILQDSDGKKVADLTAEITDSAQREYLDAASHLKTEKPFYTNDAIGSADPYPVLIQFKTTAKLPVGDSTGTIPIVVAAE